MIQRSSARWFVDRLLVLILVVGLTVGWLRWHPARTGPRSIQECVTYTSGVPETLVPTPAAGEALAVANYAPTERVARSVEPMPRPEPFSLRWRIGIGVPDGSPVFFRWPTPRPGWYLNWTASPRDEAADPALGMEYAPMLRLGSDGLSPELPTLRRLAAARPGRTWLIGNEPDVRWQGDATPEEYACYYYFAYHAIKEADPTARVAIGGLSQITPLRLQYLDRVWASYRTQFEETMPVDVWNMHAFVLREEAGVWGVDVPPGFDDVPHGELWDVEDHDDLTLVEGQIRLMRRWMAEHGQRQKPLYITEYGILMPREFGFSPGRVVDFMVRSFDLFRELRDPQLGYSADDDRLVQRWVWFSTRDRLYPTGDLFTAEGEVLPPMRAISGYIRAHSESQ